MPSYWTGYQSRPFLLSKMGRTAFLDEDVQQPKTVATPSLSRSLEAFSAKVALDDAPSSTIGTSCFPSTPPAALISSMARISASRTDVSEMAMVPESEWRIPTLMVSPTTPSLPDVAVVSSSPW